MSRRAAVVLTVVAVTVVGFTFAPAAVAAQPDGPEDPPAAYYGSLVLDGEPAPAGVQVTAYVNGEQRGSITTSEAGQFGGASALDRKLVVEGASGEEGASVEFYVNGQLANQTVDWYSGDVQEVNLAAGEGASEPGDGGDGGNGGGDGGNGGGGGDGGDGGGAGSGGGGGGGGAGAGGGGGTGSDTASVMDADVSATDAGMSVAASGVEDGTTVNAEFPSPMAAGPTALHSMSLSFSGDTGDVSVTASPTNASSLNGSVAGIDFAEPVSYFEIEKDGFSNDELAEATVSFSLDTDALPDGLAPSDVALFRFNEGQWHELPTNHEGDGEYTAETPGFSTFAVAGYQANIEVSAAELGSSEVEPGERFEVSATVENTGEADGMAVVALTIDDEIVSSRELEVDAGDTRQVTFTPQVTESGTYEVAVEEVSAGELTVQSMESGSDEQQNDGGADSQDGEANQQSDPPADGGEDTLTEQFGVQIEYVVGLLALVLVAAGAFVLRRR